MAAISTQNPTAAGAAITYGACAGGGDSFINTGRERVHIKNASGGSITVTFSSGSNKCSFGVSNVAHDRVAAIPAGSDKWFDVFPVEQFNDASGNCNITYSGVTSLTIAVLRG
jgi:hypothetical protein